MNRTLRREYLAAMGLQGWVPRVAPAVPTALLEPTRQPAPAVRAERPAPAPPTAPIAPSWQVAPIGEVAPATLIAPSAPIAPAVIAAPREAEFDWPQLQERVAACTRCALSATRTQTVFGTGSLTAEWLVVGEAPGHEEDLAGKPFVGPAGQLLTLMLRAIGLEREQVFIANVLKCRPPGNRNPLAQETVECLPFLDRQVALLKPKIMLALGRIAAQSLLLTDAPVGRLRQRTHAFGPAKIPLVVTYHPAYLLRTPGEKRKAWEDLKFAREVHARV